MSRYSKNSFSKAQDIIHNLSGGIEHPDPDLNKKLMNEIYNKEGCFYLKIDIKDLNCKSEIVGDAAAGIPALAEIIGTTFKKNNYSENLLKIFYAMVEIYYKEEGE